MMRPCRNFRYMQDIGGKMSRVSFHYEIVFSLFLREDTPADVLDELRWHLGITADRPAVVAIGGGHPVLRPEPRSYLPGAEYAVLEWQYRYTRGRLAPERPGADHHAWGLHARVYWLDDQWANTWLELASRLVPYAEDNGYAGFYREESDTYPTVLSIKDGLGYLCEWGKEPILLS